MAEERDLKYINKDFSDFRNQLIEYAKNYFPDTYNDFSPTSPGMMFIEMASYVGDVLSFYQDIQLQETYLTYAKDPKNLYSLAYMMGYRPKVTGAAEAEIQITQLVSSSANLPAWSQAAIIPINTTLTSTDQYRTPFLLSKQVDFSFSSSYDPTDVVIYELDPSNDTPQTFQLTKKAKAISGEIKEITVQIDTVEKFKTITIEDSDIIGILDIVDDSDATWKEVPFLGQDTTFSDSENTLTDSKLVPYVLTLEKAPKRFVTRFLSSGYLQIQFGAGVNSQDDSVILPDPSNVGLGMSISGELPSSRLDYAYDPSNFLYSKSYGLAPTGTLTIRYIKGGGVSANAPANTITTVNGTITDQAGTPIVQGTEFYPIFTNPKPAAGGRDGDTVEELRENSLRSFNEQSRAVTLQDYTIRALSLPPKYGSIAKVYVTQDNITNSNINSGELISSNPLALTLYTLAYDVNGKLIPSSPTLKSNLKTYLSEYMLVSDAISIRDAFIVNIGVDYEIIVRPNYSGRDVLLNCTNILKDFFHTSKWGINQPINISSIFSALDKVKGVQTVKKVEITNKAGGGYSQFGYDVAGATKNNVVYPSFDPCIFEVKYPNVDIKGRITTL